MSNSNMSIHERGPQLNTLTSTSSASSGGGVEGAVLGASDINRDEEDGVGLDDIVRISGKEKKSKARCVLRDSTCPKVIM